VNLKHKQQFGNINKDKIIGAYCVIVMTGDEAFTELMTIEEIRKAWSKSQMWGKGQTEEKEGSTHEQYRQEMAKKTVINRACKRFMNASDDSSLILTHFNGSDDRIAEAEAEAEIQEHANGEVIDVDMTPQKKNEETPNEERREAPKQEATDNPVDDFEAAATGAGPGY
jgi:recombination protein RecT